MRGFKTEGIILKRKDFGEADRILIIFTKERGKISVIAKGVRRITSRRAGNIELLNRVQLYLYQGRGMPILTEAESLENFQKLKKELKLLAASFHIIELIDKLTAENQDDKNIYFNLVEVLKRIEKNPRQILIRAFEVKILSHLGFMAFAKNIKEVGEVGGVRKILEDLEKFSWDEIEKITINKKQAMELENILRYHLERVIEGKLKSRQIMKKL